MSHMDQNAANFARGQRIALVAGWIISGAIGIVEGCREIVRLHWALPERDDNIFDLIEAVDSETEDFPVGDLRHLWESEALAKKTLEIKAYIDQIRDEVIKNCQLLIEKYAPPDG